MRVYVSVRSTDPTRGRIKYERTGLPQAPPVASACLPRDAPMASWVATLAEVAWPAEGRGWRLHRELR